MCFTMWFAKANWKVKTEEEWGKFPPTVFGSFMYAAVEEQRSGILFVRI